MTALLNFDVTFVPIECGECGVNYAFTQAFYKRKLADGTGFYCPNGHSRRFCESEVTALKKQLEQEKRKNELAETRLKWAQSEAKITEYRRRAAVGQLTKTKKRIANGVCPCCNRTFVNLAKHMATKHKDWVEPGEGES